MPVPGLRKGTENEGIALPKRIPGPGSYAKSLRISQILRRETAGGFLLVAAAVLAMILANLPLSAGYFAVRDFAVGNEPWHPKLSLAALVPVGPYALLARKCRRFFARQAGDAWLILLPLGAAVRALVHASGIHPTVAGGCWPSRFRSGPSPRALPSRSSHSSPCATPRLPSS